MTGKRRRGFASMEPEKLRAIASKGGKAAHAKGSAHRFTSEEAKEAGRKGGRAGHHKNVTPDVNKPGDFNQSGPSESGQLMGTAPYPTTTEAEFGAPPAPEPFRMNSEQPKV